MNVDIIAILGTVMEINTEHYKSDFQYDIELFQKAAEHPDGENNYLLWMSRISGTYCFYERSVYMSDTYAYHAWKYYADADDRILVYAVEITGIDNGTVKGHLYELDYYKHVRYVKRHAQTPVDVILLLKDGTQQLIPFDEYIKSSNITLHSKYGEVERLRYIVPDEDVIQQSLKQARNERQKNTAITFKSRNSIPDLPARHKKKTEKER